MRRVLLGIDSLSRNWPVAMITPYDNWKTSDPEGDVWIAQNMAIGELVAMWENDPSEVRAALGSYNSDDYDRLDELEIKAHLSGLDEDWDALIAERKRLMAAYFLRKARNQVLDETAKRPAYSANMFANWLHRGATDKFSGTED